MESRHKESLAAMREYTALHLKELCVELIEWHDTALLRDGRMRELAGLCTFDDSNHIRQAERMIENAALRVVAGG